MKTVGMGVVTKREFHRMVGWGIPNHPGCKSCRYACSSNRCGHPDHMRKPGKKHPKGGGPRPRYIFNGGGSCILWESSTGRTLASVVISPRIEVIEDDK